MVTGAPARFILRIGWAETVATGAGAPFNNHRRGAGKLLPPGPSPQKSCSGWLPMRAGRPGAPRGSSETRIGYLGLLPFFRMKSFR